MKVYRTLAAANKAANGAYRNAWSVSIERERSPVHTARFEYVVRTYGRYDVIMADRDSYAAAVLLRFDPKPLDLSKLRADTGIYPAAPIVVTHYDVAYGWSEWAERYQLSPEHYARGVAILGTEWQYYAREGYSALERASREESTLRTCYTSDISPYKVR